jgi:kynurenine aminotransferase
MPGEKVVYVPLQPPKNGSTTTTSSSEWTLDIAELEAVITLRNKMIVINTPRNPIGKIFSEAELTAIGNLGVKGNIIILSDEVYDTLYYIPFTRIAALNPDFARLTLTVGSGTLPPSTPSPLLISIFPSHPTNPPIQPENPST